MKKILFLLLILISTKSMYAIKPDVSFPKDTIWSIYNFKHYFQNPLFSKDGKKIYANTTLGVLTLDVKTGDSLDYFSGYGNISYEAEDGSYFINQDLAKYSFKSKELLWKCPIRDDKEFYHMGGVLSQNGKLALRAYFSLQGVVNPNKNYIDIYNSVTYEKVNSLIFDSPTNYRLVPNKFALCNDGKFALIVVYTDLSSISYNYKGFLFDIVNNKILKQLWEVKDAESSLLSSFSSNNTYAVSSWGQFPTIIELKTMNTYSYTSTGLGHFENRISIISNDEKYLLSAGSKVDGLEMYDLLQKKIVYTPENTDATTNVFFANINQNNNLLVGGGGSILYLLDMTKTSLKEPTQNVEETISPNPTNGRLIINNLPSETKYNLRLSNSSGQIIKNENIVSNNSTIEYNLSYLPNGSYFLQLSNNNFNQTYKIVKE